MSLLLHYWSNFRFGLRNDVNDLLHTFPKDPNALTEAISCVVQFDNRLFEPSLECQQRLVTSRSAPTYGSIATQTTPRATYASIPADI
jgi:hypothetical protein